MAKGELARYKSKALEAVKQNRRQVREGVSMIEMGVGAFGGGYLRVQYPEGLGGVPVDAGLALLMVGLGFGMKQKDLTAIGLGFGMGYLSSLGEKVGVENPMTDAASNLRVVV